MTDNINKYFNSLKSLIDSIEADQLVNVAQVILATIESGNSIFIAGNGGSSATATHLSNDLLKIARIKGKRGIAIQSLSENPSIITAISNDYSYVESYKAQLDVMMKPNDLFIAFSASGASQNILSACGSAKESNGIIIGITGFDGGELHKIADHSIHVHSEPGCYEEIEDVHLSIAHLLSKLVSSKL